MSKFDALAIEVEKPSRMPIKHPNTNMPLRDKDGNEAYIELYSSDSDIARKMQRTITNSRLQMRNRNKLTADRLESEATELLAALTVGWHLVNWRTGEKIDVEFSRSNAEELYSGPGMQWIREQVDEFVADRSVFSQASSTN